MCILFGFMSSQLGYVGLIAYDGIMYLFKEQRKDRDLEREKKGEIQKEASPLCDPKEGLP